MTNKVRTTINPNIELTVDDRELAELEALGLLVKTSASTPEGVARAAVKQVEASKDS